MQIQYTKNLIPGRFELGTTLSQPNRSIARQQILSGVVVQVMAADTTLRVRFLLSLFSFFSLKTEETYAPLLKSARRCAASLRYRNRAEITILICKQKLYPEQLSCGPKRYPILCKYSPGKSNHDTEKTQGAKKIIFTACHSGKLKLAFTSLNVISTSPKNLFYQQN